MSCLLNLPTQPIFLIFYSILYSIIILVLANKWILIRTWIPILTVTHTHTHTEIHHQIWKKRTEFVDSYKFISYYYYREKRMNESVDSRIYYNITRIKLTHFISFLFVWSFLVIPQSHLLYYGLYSRYYGNNNNNNKRTQ